MINLITVVLIGSVYANEITGVVYFPWNATDATFWMTVSCPGDLNNNVTVVTTDKKTIFNYNSYSLTPGRTVTVVTNGSPCDDVIAASEVTVNYGVGQVDQMYFGNSFGGFDDQWVQIRVYNIWVHSADGTIYAASNYDENGHEVGIYRDGKVVGHFQDLHGWWRGGGYAVACDGEKYCWASVYQGNIPFNLQKYGAPVPPCTMQYSIRRYTPEGVPAPYTTDPNIIHQNRSGWDGSFTLISEDCPQKYGAPVTGISVKNNLVYATDYSQKAIRVFHTESMNEETSLRIDVAPYYPFQLNIAPNGKAIWVIQRDAPFGVASVVAYSLTGGNYGRVVSTISGLVDPTAIATDSKGEYLLVTENGPAQQVFVYDLSTNTKVNSFGEEGGVFFNTKESEWGVNAPLRFNGLSGVAVDENNLLYVATNGYGVNGRPEHDLTPTISPELGLYTSIRIYSLAPDKGLRDPQPQLKDELYCLLFVDAADISLDGQNIYTVNHRLAPAQPFGTTDQNNPLHLSYQWASITLDRWHFPDDFRLHLARSSLQSQNVQGHMFLFMSSQYPTAGMAVYRLQGEIAVPAGYLYLDVEKNTWPEPVAGHIGPWIWTDLNGDGKWNNSQKNEFNLQSNLTSAGGHSYAWFTDSEGNIWAARENLESDNTIHIYKLLLKSITNKGVPIYDTWDTATVFKVPGTEFYRVERIVYFPESDTMFLTGYITNDWPADWGLAGTHVFRYDNWSTNNRKIRFILPVPNHLKSTSPDKINAPYNSPDTINVLNDVLYIGYEVGLALSLYNATDGSPLLPHQPVGIVPLPDLAANLTLVDMPFGRSGRVVNGDTWIITEEDGKGKNVLFRFQALPKN